MRHRRVDVDVEIRGDARSATTVELRRGAVWLRAVDDGLGVVFVHGATTVELRGGAAVVEVHDSDAVLVVVAGRAAIEGAPDLPRTVSAGQAVTLALDGSFEQLKTMTAAQLAGDRMVVENLARDALGSGGASPSPGSDDDGGDAAAAAAADPDPASAVRSSAGPAPGPAPDRSSRRWLVGLVVAALVVVAIVAATALSADDEVTDGAARVGSSATTTADDVTDGAPRTGSTATTTDDDEPAPTTRPPPEATGELQDCASLSLGWVARGTVRGGGQRTSRYDVEVGVRDGEGRLYARQTQRVVPRTDRSQPAEWEIIVPVPEEGVRRGSDCELVEVTPLRVPPA